VIRPKELEASAESQDTTEEGDDNSTAETKSADPRGNPDATPEAEE